jgi:hypothetical protein
MTVTAKPGLERGHAAFGEFRQCLAEETVRAFPQFVSLWGKWNPEDLIPFLSDFDSRLVCRAPMRPEDWVELDRVSGEIHLAMLKAHPDWARILEHTPGVCATEEEMLDDRTFHPETQQWSAYSDCGEFCRRLQGFYEGGVWGNRHEVYFLRRFLYYYGPYQHGIDPPINLGAYEYKYALHSRLWHYFVPALQAALALVNRRAIRGKFETLHGWLQHFPSHPILLRALEIVGNHYESAELTDASALARLEADLFAFLQKVMRMVRERVTLIEMSDSMDSGAYKELVAGICPVPLMTIYDGVRFSRIRKGRYYFYLNSPAFFDAGRLIASETKWLKGYFTAPIFKAYAQLRWSQPALTLGEILHELRHGLIDARDEQLIRRVFSLSLDGHGGHERDIIAQIAEVYAEYHLILERILADGLARA